MSDKPSQDAALTFLSGVFFGWIGTGSFCVAVLLAGIAADLSAIRGYLKADHD
jgi:hypothetical protein